MGIRESKSYLSQREHAFWRWVSNDGCVQWQNGTTIAFAKELSLVLERFQERGLPRLDCILLVIAALRTSWNCFNVNADQDRNLLSFLKGSMLSDSIALQLIQQLDRLNGISRKLSKSFVHQSLLAEMILEKLPIRCEASDSRHVVQALRETCDGFFFINELRIVPSEILYIWRMDLAHLLSVLEGFSEQSIRSRIATGVDEPIQPDDLKLDESERRPALDEFYSDALEARELIETLVQDSENHSLGRLAKDLLAALYRPARLVPEKTLHMEGYSDISNRGNLDRLLMSELAYDDETLAVRVAQGEALYMRRETPPSRETLDRCILIDCGIRSWGTPRIYSAAVGLALTASASQSAHVFAWKTQQETIERSFFTDQSGLSLHLESMHAGLQPANVLESFCESVAQSSTNAEVYLVLTRDVWEDIDFRIALRNSKLTGLTAAIVDRLGNLELVEYSRAGTRSIKRMQIKLVQPNANTDVSERTASGDASSLITHEKLPKIFDCNPFPLRLSTSNVKQYAVDCGRLLGYSHDRQLVLWDAHDLGYVVLKASMPRGELLGTGLNESGTILWVVWGELSKTSRWLLRFNAGDYSFMGQVEFDFQSGPAFFAMPQNDLLMSANRFFQAWNIVDGSGVPHSVNGDVCGSNLFRDKNGDWIAAHFNGLGYDLVPVVFQGVRSSRDLLFVGPGPVHKGFVAITASGRLLHSNGSDEPLPPWIEKPLSSRDIAMVGNNRWIQIPTSTGLVALEMDDDGKPSGCHSNPAKTNSWSCIVWGADKALPSRSYRNRFHRIGIVDGKLSLMRNQNVLSLNYESNGLVWRAKSLAESHIVNAEQSFEYDRELSREKVFRLEFARSGSIEAILDSRGMLHLRSLDNRHRQITLLIQDGLASGWISDGHWFGTPYHCGHHPLINASKMGLDVLLHIIDGWKS